MLARPNVLTRKRLDRSSGWGVDDEVSGVWVGALDVRCQICGALETLSTVCEERVVGIQWMASCEVAEARRAPVVGPQGCTVDQCRTRSPITRRDCG